MAFVPIPKDLTDVKSKIMFNLTGRQLLNFLLAGIIAIPTFILTKDFLGNELSIVLVMILAAPFMFFAFFEKDGLSGEKYLRAVIDFKYNSSPIRVYKNTNFYETIDDIQRLEKQFIANKETIQMNEQKKKESKKSKCKEG